MLFFPSLLAQIATHAILIHDDNSLFFFKVRHLISKTFLYKTRICSHRQKNLRGLAVSFVKFVITFKTTSLLSPTYECHEGKLPSCSGAADGKTSNYQSTRHRTTCHRSAGRSIASHSRIHRQLSRPHGRSLWVNRFSVCMGMRTDKRCTANRRSCSSAETILLARVVRRCTETVSHSQ